MAKPYLTTAVIAAAAALSICDVCLTGGARSSAFRPGFANAALPLRQAIASAAIDTQTVTLRVEGMTCGGCVIGVRRVLERLAGVETAEVSYEKQRAVVTYDPTRVTVEQMIAAIATLKYKATVVPA